MTCSTTPSPLVLTLLMVKDFLNVEVVRACRRVERYSELASIRTSNLFTASILQCFGLSCVALASTSTAARNCVLLPTFAA